MGDPPRKPEAIRRREADTARLVAPAQFTARLAPAIGEGRQPGAPADGLFPAVAEARDAAPVSAFAAIGRISDHTDGGPS